MNIPFESFKTSWGVTKFTQGWTYIPGAAGFLNHQQFHPQQSPFFVLQGDKIIKIPEEFEEFPPPTKPTVLTRVCRGSVFRARLEDHPHPNPDFDQEIVGKHVCGGN